MNTGRIHVGIGGWVYAPWRETFYPPDLKRADELRYAASRLTAIEINATFHRTQSAASFRNWRTQVPDGFVFAVKGPRFATWRGVLAEAGPSIARFMDSGVAELADRLGPINWQFAPTKRFEADDIARFLDLLPRAAGGVALRHAIEARHESFNAAEFARMVHERGMGIVLADSDKHPALGAPDAPFIYARLQRTREDEARGYPADELADWAARFRAHAAQRRDVFAFFIAGFKAKAPLAAQALIARLASVA
jgi:uncharacterized protein YecE (DUF72 family)